jgi:hypothetical protein
MEWLALLIPTAAALWLHHADSRRFPAYKAAFLLFPCAILIPLVMLGAGRSLCVDVEWHGGWVVEARYFEDWNEYIHKTCTETTTDSEGRMSTRTYDCSYVDYHSEYWELEDCNGYVVAITQSDYAALVQKLGGAVFRDMHRYYHTNDGDQYAAVWTSTYEKQPVVTKHWYENRILGSRHTLNRFPPVPEGSAIYEYPEQMHALRDTPILGSDPQLQQATKLLSLYNAELGPSRQARIWVCLFDSTDRQLGLLQEAHWQGANKNEFVVCLGVSQEKVAWCHSFCWAPVGNTSNDLLKVKARDLALNATSWDLIQFVADLAPLVEAHFVRKSSKELQYLTTDNYGFWSYAAVYLAVIAVSGVSGAMCFSKELPCSRHW